MRPRLFLAPLLVIVSTSAAADLPDAE